jgi:chemotaxis protein methyltransferase CheR
MNTDPGIFQAPQLSPNDFKRLSALVKRHSGINLHEGKQELVKARLNKRLRELGMSTYQEYLDFLQSDATGDEFIIMLNSLSTNVTSFFRESDHFTFLSQTYFPQLRARKAEHDRHIRFWSAGCSSGEEPYTLALVFKEGWADLGNWDVRILATDLSTRVLNNAKQGIYDEPKLADIPRSLRERYFTPLKSKSVEQYQVKENIRSLVHFARLNLLDPWPMRGPFDAIFCRNVMIYFEKKLREQLVNKYWELLAPGGIFFIGHSESLAGITHKFQYVAPTIYKK